MSYPFPEIKRHIFNWTFLRDVTLSLIFHVDSSDVDYIALSSFFEKNFSIPKLKEDALGIDKGIKIQSGDENILFNFSFNKLELKIRHPLYTEFKKMLFWWPVIAEFFKIVGVTEIKQLTIRKYNELAFSLPKGSGNVVLAIKEIFSSNLLDEDFYKDAESFPSLNRWERKMIMTDGDSSTQVNINFGFCEKDDIASKKALTLSTSVSTMDSSTIVSDAEMRLDQMNHIIDRAFRWCVTDSIINKMNGRKDE